jgi:hypothetical protein
MPTMHYEKNAAWANYHQTLGGFEPGGTGPVMRIESLARIAASDAIHASGLARFAATAATLFGHLRDLETKLETSDAPFAAGIVGSGWSFAPLIGTPVSQLLCGKDSKEPTAGLSGTRQLAADERHDDCTVPADYIALASGGASMRDIAEWAERRSRTLITSGSFLGTTIAGGFATASHGSRLGYGGIQNMVLGMHLIVGSREHVWIERKSCPVLSQAGLDRLAADGVAVQGIADDEQFEDALIHLGAMGIVNGVALKLTDNDKFALMQRMEVLTPAWLKHIAAGEFTEIARKLGCLSKPSFYELTLNPHAPFTDGSTHTMYFPSNPAQLMPAGPADITVPAEAIARLGWSMLPMGGGLREIDHGQDLHLSSAPNPIPPWVLRRIFNGSDSAFAYYCNLKTFDPIDEVFDPEDLSTPAYQWSELHKGEITSGIPGALYNASFAIRIDDVPTVIPMLCAAVADLAPAFIFTLRFVCKAKGTLAFTRFDHSAVIEIDGLSPLICLLAKTKVSSNNPNAAVLIQALDELSITVQNGARAIRKALDDAHIPHSMHWGKLGDLDQAKVYADYENPSLPDSLIRRWRETRDALLSPFGKKIFWNDAVVSYGLVDDVK